MADADPDADPDTDPETDPDNAQWVWDEVPHYQLNEEIINEYLLELWEGYKFFIEVRGSSPSMLVR